MTPRLHPLVSVDRVSKAFGKQGLLSHKFAGVRAVRNVSLYIAHGEVVSLVGESGCGKSTLGRLIVRLHEPSEGRIFFDGQEITSLSPGAMLPLRKHMQMIFQDPYASLNPRMTVRQTIEKTLRVHNMFHDLENVRTILSEVGLNPELMDRYPHEFSGGQRQRIAIGRAIAIRPKFVVCDEPVSALDASVQAQVINLLCDLHEQLGLAYLFISHDLSMVRHISDRIIVMYMGCVVEIQSKEAFFRQPLHPYSQALLSAIPVANPHMQSSRARIVLHGDLPSAAADFQGCPFYNRCQKAQPDCRNTVPQLLEYEPGRQVACLYPNA